jgi:alkylation response protein AidB-like acyl-CoA dehydrogenase
MDSNDTPEVAAFRTDCRSWLAAHARTRGRRAGTELIALLGQAVDTEATLVEARSWQARAAADGWAAIGWPREFGGRGASLPEQIAYQEEAAAFDLPDDVFRIGITMGGPTVIAHGTDEQRARWLPPLLTGEEIWCQLFSEPEAGSDLASLRTTATRVDGGWIVRGQKVWSSGAHYSQRGMLLARTDPGLPKHAGITYFVLDMASPGIEVRPLRQMTGSAHFNEVFLTDVWIPDTDRLGPVDGGWRVAQTTLLNERATITELISEGAITAGLVELACQAGAQGRPGTDDTRTRQALAQIHTDETILNLIGQRIVDAFARGQLPGPEASVAKLAMGRLLRRASDLALQLAGPDATLAGPGADGVDGWRHTFLAAPAVRIAGGSDEVQRNIIGERVLGLPKEPGPPRDTPFRDLHTTSMSEPP